MKGADVSSWQGLIDWAAVRAGGVEFVFVRIADGLHVDALARDNIRGARAAGIARVGVYQYLRPISWQEQADVFLEVLGELEVDFVAIDIEDPTLVAVEAGIDALAWLRYVEHPFAYCYCGEEPATRLRLAEVPELGAFPLWLGDYRRNPKVPKPWNEAAIFQYTGSGRTSGVRGPVDLDVTAPGWELPG